LSNIKDLLVNGINVIAVQGLNSSLANSSDFIFDCALSAVVDDIPPVVENVIPQNGAFTRQFSSLEVQFSEPVTGVDASDLLVNGVPAGNLTIVTPADYLFEFPEPAPGAQHVSFAASHGITDLASARNAFAGANWTFNFDPNAPVPGIMISEFMADNHDTLNDEDGDHSDWIEIFNPTEEPADLTGWFLSNDPDNLAEWKLPSVSLDANSYLVIFASGKDRRNPASKLHTNFKLSKDGDFLALLDSRTNVVSSFAPQYPPQEEDISYGRDRGNESILGYFTSPTPGGPNVPGGPGFASEVKFSRTGGTFTQAFQLTLTAASSNAVIHYVIGTNLPTEASSVYTGPILVNQTCEVRARAFETGLLPGKPRSENYVALSASVINTTSDLPIVILHTLGNGGPSASADKFVMMQIYEPKNGVASMTNAPDLSERARFKIRGSSTEGNAKYSLAVETWDEFGDDKKVKVVGMPEESDWVFYAPNFFEPVLIHNPFMYELSREVGRYAPGTRFAEVYVNTTGGSVSSAQYFGIYVIEEKIKRGADRVAIDKLEPEHLNPPEVTGGYLLKIDRSDPNDSPFNAGGQSINYVDPKGPIIRTPARNAQEQYIINYFNQFGNALNGVNYKDPVNGYAPFMDIPSWIDHHILNVLAFNVDALRLSTYFYKPREGKITFGPIWDFDRALGSTDGRDANPRVWANSSGTDFFNYPWWGRLFSDPDFWQAWIDRYEQMRADQLSLTNLNRLIDDLSTEVQKAQPREQARWGVTPRNGSYRGEVSLMKTYLANRVNFMDTQFVAAPLLSVPEGPVTNRTSVSIEAPVGARIYFTLDGSDPRGPGGDILNSAQNYIGPIHLFSNARIFARAYDPNHKNLTGSLKPVLSSPWSGFAVATYVVATPSLAITEIMYNPPESPGGINDTNEDYEYLEVKNTGNSVLELAGFKFTRGIDFTFTGGALNPGERALIVKNRTVFESRYGSGLNILGEFGGSLDNSGERITLEGPLKEPISDFSYNDAWYPTTDGLGFSLVLRDEKTPFSDYGNAASWRASSSFLGSPDNPDGEPSSFPGVYVNEALTHTDPPEVDSIELYNGGASAADISGWYLTDDFFAPAKYKIPAGTSIPAGSYLVFDEAQFNRGSEAFSLSSLGDEVYLFSANGNGDLTGYYHGFEFGAAVNGISFGRQATSDGRELFLAQNSTTLGSANSGVAVGPAIISEIMFQPPPIGTNDNTVQEFIEIQNISGQDLPLYDINFPTNAWRLRGGADFDLPAGITLPAGNVLLIVNFDPVTDTQAAADFRSRFSVAPTVLLLGPLSGKLGNTGERISLQKPDAPQRPGAVDEGFVPYVVVEELNYHSTSPWPESAAGTGQSLQRISAIADDPASWKAANPTAGIANYGIIQDDDNDGLPNDWEIAHGFDPENADGVNGAQGDPDGDNLTNLQEFISGTDPRDAASYLKIDAFTMTGGNHQITFQAAPQKSYSIYYRTNLIEGSWIKLKDVPASPTPTVQVITDGTANDFARFYRLVTPQQ
jgi:hypothetical protein